VSKDFDGIDDVIVVPAAGPNQVANYTVASWIFPTQTVTTGVLFGRLNTALGYGTTYHLAGAGNDIIEHWQNGLRRLSSPVGSTPPNRWCFWAVTHDGTDGRLYTARFNDRALTLEETTTYGSQTFENLAHQIGLEGVSSDPYLGLIGHFSIWDAALSLEQIDRLRIQPFAPLHRFSVGGTVVALRLHYSLWESAADQSSPARDYSGNGNDGTVTGTTKGAEPPTHLFGRVIAPVGVTAAVTAVYSGRGIGRGLHRGIYR